MNIRFGMALVSAMLATSLACGSNDEAGSSSSAAAANTTPSSSVSQAGADVVAGKVASTMAPPASLIALVPQPPIELPVKSEPAVMDQAGYEFLPGFLVAQAGQDVEFRNSEDILHNVRVTETSQQKPVFNVATVAFGKYSHRFEPGVYNVTCDIHPTMRATILVTVTPYTASVGEDGSFSMANVKPGAYKLTVYAPSGPVDRDIEVKPGGNDLGTIQ